MGRQARWDEIKACNYETEIQEYSYPYVYGYAEAYKRPHVVPNSKYLRGWCIDNGIDYKSIFVDEQES